MKPIMYLLAFLFPLSLWAQDAKNRIDKLIDYIEVHNQSIGVISVYKDSTEVYQRQFTSSLKNYVIKDLLHIPYELPVFRTGVVIGLSVDRLVGTYYNEVKDFKIFFSKDGDYLGATQLNRLTYLLDYKDKLIFEVPNEEAHIEFVPDEDKMILHQNNEQIVFRKILRR